MDNTSYQWSPGFWAIAVGFYGGVNYGNGYFGHGYTGGRWHGNTFQYNTYVTRVNTTVVRNVYVDRTVIVNHDTTRVSYSGGSNGVQARPTSRELEVSHEKHLPVTTAQVQHIKVAEQDRRLLATVNHDRPPVVAVARPMTVTSKPAGFEAVKPVVHPAPQYRAPALKPAPVFHPTTSVKPEYRAPVGARPAYRTPADVAPAAPAVQRPAYRAPAYRAPAVVQPARVIPPPPHANAPAYRAPVTRFAPTVRTAPVHPAFVRPPAQRPAPAQQPQHRDDKR